MSIATEQSRRIPPSTLPLRLQLAREWRGYTQDELAEVLDVSRATISNYERGVGVKGISRLQMNAWAAFCDVDVDWLRTGDETPQTAPDGGGVTATYQFGTRPPRGGRPSVGGTLSLITTARREAAAA